MHATLNAVRQDLRYSFRTLKRARAFTLFAVATLALGISASTTTFAVVDAVLLKPLPFLDPQRLATVRPDSGSRVSERYMYAWWSQRRTLIDLAGWYDTQMILSGREEPVNVLVDRTTPNFFAVLGAPALLGRTFFYVSDLQHVEREVVLSYGLWRRRFNGEPGVIGQSVRLDGAEYNIVGVMPSGFAIRTNELPESRAELWTPFRVDPDSGVGMGGSLNVVARLAGDTSFQQAQVDLATIANGLEASRPSFTRNWRVEVIPLRDATVKTVRTTLLVLFGAVGILLLIACVNIATLLLSRATTRSMEVAVRMSLGATSARLIQQFMIENILVAACGGSIGVLLAVWGTHLLVTRLPSALDLPRVGQISVDFRTLGFALGVTALTVIVFGVLPAIRAVRVVPQKSLQRGARSSSRSSSRRSGNALLVVQIALALTLLAGAGLLTRSFEKLTHVDLGFRRDNVVTIRTTLSAVQYTTDDRIRGFINELHSRAAAIPGVQAVGSANYVPLSNVGEGAAFEIEGRSYARPDEQPGSWRSVVGGQYFEAMGIPLLRGRLPGSIDTDHTQPVALIDEVLARRYWSGANPIGARLLFKQGDGAKSSVVIIGIVGNVRWMAASAEPPGTTYLWSPQHPGREITLIARVNGDASRAVKALAQAITDVDTGQPVSDIRTLDDLVSADVARPRFIMLVLAGFASAALVLAAIGIYSVISFSVLQRTREIGVRLALGARPGDVLRLFMSRGVVVTGVGAVTGIGCTLALGRVVEGLLYEVRSRDPLSVVAATVFVLLVATAASYIPASRATRLDPLIALRRE